MHFFSNVVLRRPFLVLLGLAGFLLPLHLSAADTANEFRKPTIDLGMFVKDADRTARFLTNAIGFRELPGFSVGAAMGNKIGLVDHQPFSVRVFALDDVDQATRIKVLTFPQVEGKQPDQAYVHSMLGMRYLTLYVKDMNRALERLKAAKVTLLGETPVDLGGGTMLVAVKDPDGNFYELIGPRSK
jgi:catechol 2,3-dioxygenase-like lactoylglutathione lyase family enzyme